MTELKPIYFEADGEVHELDVKVKVVDEDNPYDEERGVVETI